MPGLRAPSLLGPALLGPVLLLGACTEVLDRPEIDPPAVSLASVEAADPAAPQAGYRMVLRVRNPNPMPLPILGMRLHLDLAGRPFADLVTPQALDLPAYAEAPLELRAHPPRPFEILSDPERPALPYRLKGEAGFANDLPTMEFSGEGSLPAPSTHSGASGQAAP